LQWEEKSFFDRWDYMLGLSWTEEDILALASGLDTNDGPKNIADLESQEKPSSGTLRFPLSLLIRPELIKQLQERVLPAQRSKRGMPHVPASALSLSDVRKEDFLRKLGATPVGDRDFSDGGDMFDQPNRTQGFREGPMRTIGGGKRR
jgi:hypothetical protein